jgi:hypothetical protein
MKWTWMVVSVLAAACGGGSSSSGINTFNGTIHGQSFSPTESISNTVLVAAGTGNTAGVVVMSNATGTCADVTANKQPKNITVMIIALEDVNITTGAFTAPTAPGTYTVSVSPQAKLALVNFVVTDANCKAISSQSATSASGTVTITSVSNGTYEGTYDITMNSNDHVTGSFSASACAGISPAFVSGNANPTCF